VSTFEFLGDHVRSVLPRTSILELAEQPESEWDIRKHTHLLYSLAPNPGPDGFSEKARGFLAANSAFTRKTLEEDFEIAEQIQRGMRTVA
jgi:hypothetical protein